MALSKEQLRKMYGVTEPTDPPDPEVLARRSKHEAAAKWCARWVPDLRYACLTIGFLFVFLPSVWDAWGRIVSIIPILSTLSYDYSHLRGIFRVHFPVVLLLSAIGACFAPHRPQGAVRLTDYSETVAMELYPTTKKSERAYYVCMIDNVLGTSLFLALPFGFIAFLLNIGK